MRPSVSRLCAPFLVYALCAAPLRAFAEPAAADALTLAAAVEAALEQGGEARIAGLATEQTEHAAGQLRSAWLPQVVVTSGAGYSNRQNEKLRTVDKAGAERVYGLASLGSSDGWFNFFVDQLIFDLRRYKELQLADAEVEAARAREVRRREAIAAQVFDDFVAVVHAERRMAVDDERIADARNFARLVASLARAGEVLEEQWLETELLVERAELERDQDALALDTSKRKLALDVGLAPSESASLRIAASSLPSYSAEIHAESLERKLTSTAELRVLELRRRVEHLRSEAARAGRLPRVGVRGGYSNYGANRYDLFEDEWRVGVDVTVPLFDGLRARHEIAGADNGEEMARIEYDLSLERKRRRMADLAGRVVLAGRASDLSRRAAENARKHVRIVDLRLRSKRASVGEALAARSEAHEAALRELASRFESLRLWAMLQREVDGLAEALGVTERTTGTE